MESVPSEPLRDWPARRISTANGGASGADETCRIAVEAPVTIVADGAPLRTLLCSPVDVEPLAAGFLLTEGFVASRHDILDVSRPADAPDVVHVRLAPDVARPRARDAATVSALPKVTDSFRVASEVLGRVVRDMHERQKTFAQTGGTHAAGVFDSDGRIIAFAEDVARHNALDKAVGRCLLDGRSAAGCGVALSGRVSFQIVAKCARAGLELANAVSAPMSLALDAASAAGITICAFVRQTRATVFTHPHRVG